MAVNSAEITTVESLPDELLLNIFSAVPHTSFVDVSHVCRRWARLVRSFTKLRLFSIQRNVDDAFLLDLLDCMQPEEVTLKGCRDVSEFGFAVLRQVRPKLYCLRIDDAQMTTTSFRQLCQFTYLKELSLSGTHVTDVSVGREETETGRLAFADSLTKLVLSNTAVTRMFELSNLRRLEHLDISSPTGRNLRGLAQCPSLKTLILRDTRPQFIRDFAQTHHSLGFLANLVRLELHDVHVYADHNPTSPWAPLGEILLACTRLERLVLASLRGVEICDDIFCDWVKAVPSLTSLEIKTTEADRLTDRALRSIADSFGHNLHNLVLFGWSVTDAGVKDLAYKCSGLTTLGLPWCRRISDWALFALSELCPQLHQLDISGCCNITAAGITRAAYSMNIRRLRMFGVHAGATAIPYAAARGAEVMYRPPVVMTTESSRALAISDDQPTLCCHGCRVQVLLDDSEEHDFQCDGKIARCPNAQYGCSAPLKRQDIAAHLPTCRAYYVKCTFKGCGSSFLRSRISTHLLEHNARDNLLPALRCPMTIYCGCRFVAHSHSQLLNHVQQCREELVAAEGPKSVPPTHGVSNAQIMFRRKEYEADANGMTEPGEPKPLFRRRLVAQYY